MQSESNCKRPAALEAAKSADFVDDEFATHISVLFELFKTKNAAAYGDGLEAGLIYLIFVNISKFYILYRVLAHCFARVGF